MEASLKPECNNVTRDLPAGHVVTKQPWKDADVCIVYIKPNNSNDYLHNLKRTFLCVSASPHEELYIQNCTLSDI